MRRCLLEPIPELDLAAKLLDAATDALIQNRRDLAAELIVRADIQLITEYADKIIGKMSPEIHRHMRRPDSLPEDERHPDRMPNSTVQNEIFGNDGWHCRFCGSKVVCSNARDILIGLYPNETHWSKEWRNCHPALYAMTASLDHVLPHSRGGKNDISNFITACYCCQFGRGALTLEEAELLDPRDKEPIASEWDGLTRLNRIAAK